MHFTLLFYHVEYLFYYVHRELPNPTDEISRFPVVYFFEAYLDWAENPPTIPPNLTHTRDGTRLTRHAYGKFQDNKFLFGGDRMYFNESCDIDQKLLSELLQAKVFPVLPVLREHFDVVEESGAWAGLMPFSDDGKPIIGEVSDKLWVATGYGGEGMMIGPVSMFLFSEWLRARLDHNKEKKSKTHYTPPLLLEYKIRPRK